MTTTEQIVTHPSSGKPVLRIIREERDNGTLLARTLKPKAVRHTHYFSFKTAERREQWINEQIAHALSRASEKDARHAARTQFRHGYQVGDMLHGSWGYDQTNCEFYQVVKTTEKTITVRALGALPVPGTDGFMCQSLIPHGGSMHGPEIRAVVRPSYDGKGKGSCTIDHASCCETEPTKAHYSSWYA
jgi:hypothetical protein